MLRRRMPLPSKRSGCCPGKGPLRRAFVVEGNGQVRCRRAWSRHVGAACVPGRILGNTAAHGIAGSVDCVDRGIGKQVAAATFGKPGAAALSRQIAPSPSPRINGRAQRAATELRLSSTRHPVHAGWAHFSGAVMSVVRLGRLLPLFRQGQPLRHRDVRPRGTRTVGARSTHAPRYAGQPGRGRVLALSATL